ncbi:MAG: hypothetical protein C0412_09070 [Flavobacterium sp.]|nr:hypothetical protein [Flavobacterium sp.]
MKKIICLLILIAGVSFPQSQEKGKISLTLVLPNSRFDPTVQIDLPFKSISVQKDDKYVVKARGEINTEKEQTMINMEIELSFSLNKFLADPNNQDSVKKKMKDYNEFTITALEIYKKRTMLNVECSVMFKPQDFGKYELRTDMVHNTWATQKIIKKVEDMKLNRVNGQTIISGKFKYILLSDGTEKGTSIITEIKDGYFEIII